MKQFKWSVVLLAFLLTAMVIVPMVSAANTNDVYYTDILITHKGSLSDEMQKNVALKNAESKIWISKLQKVADESEIQLDKFLYPNGSVIGIGYDMYGTMIVQINKDSKINPSEIEEVYQIIQKTGEINGIQEIPCKFLSIGLLKTEARYTRTRPLIGGLEIGASNGWGTIGFRARDASGNLGFVTAGHVGNLGTTVYQPDSGLAADSVGTVSSTGGTNSDSEFIRYSNTAATFYYTDTITLGYVSYANNPTVGSYVYKSGAATDITSGQVVFISSVYSPYYGRYLPNQGYAQYSSSSGDSGAPVYTWDYFNAELVGIHMGQVDPGYGVFSPISGIRSDLGITPAL